MFFDDTFTIHRARAMELMERILHAKRTGALPEDVHFYGFTRANTLDRELLVLMKEAGCDKLSLGVETGNAAVLEAMQKGTKLDDYRNAYALLDELGITKRGSFIIGHPYETEETLWDSINFARELDLDEIGVNIMTPYPGQVTFRDAYESRGIWFSAHIHYADLREGAGSLRDGWSDYIAVNWHDYWRDHLRWGRAVVETETLSQEALVYWHARFLQEVYGSKEMAKRRERFIKMGNDDEYWHRPWRVHSQHNVERIERERVEGMPAFPEPLHKRHVYDPLPLQDYQKNELFMTENRRRRLEADKAVPEHVLA